MTSPEIATLPATRQIQAGPWRVTLHRPVLVYRGTRDEHVTRPNLCVLRGGAIGAIFQTTFDTSATLCDRRHVCISTDEGRTWRVAGENLDIGSYSLFSKSNGDVVTMPYDSIRFGPDPSSFAGPRATLSWDGASLHVRHDTTTAHCPAPLMTFASEPIMDDSGKPLYLEDDLPPADKPIMAFWGTIQQLGDGRWIVPVYGSYASDERAQSSPAPEMRRMARATAQLFVSADEGRTWSWYSQVAAPNDVPEECVEGPTEVQLYRFDRNHWRAIFRTSALKNFFQPMRYAESVDAGKTWSKARMVPESVKMIMDPRGLMLRDIRMTVLSAGRPKFDAYFAAVDSLDFHSLGLTSHHDAYYPRLRTTGHTDVVRVGERSLLIVYDYIPDSWRWPGSPFTAPDEIYAVRIDIE